MLHIFKQSQDQSINQSISQSLKVQTMYRLEDASSRLPFRVTFYLQNFSNHSFYFALYYEYYYILPHVGKVAVLYAETFYHFPLHYLC